MEDKKIEPGGGLSNPNPPVRKCDEDTEKAETKQAKPETKVIKPDTK